MLRVTVHKTDIAEVLELEGKLSGDWVKELERCWREVEARPGTAVQVLLKAVGYIDESGKQLLAEMHRRGVEIKGCGCMARAVVEEITREVSSKEQSFPKKILGVILLATFWALTQA